MGRASLRVESRETSTTPAERDAAAWRRVAARITGVSSPVTRNVVVELAESCGSRGAGVAVEAAAIDGRLRRRP